MSYTVIVSQTAKNQLAACVSFLANVSKPAAKTVKENLLTAIRSLSEMPNRYPFIDEDYLPRNKYHKLYAGGYYLILYQIKDTTVYVDYVLDCRTDYPWLFREKGNI